MKFSELFSRTKKEPPKDETAINAILLSRAGFVHKEMAGVYSLMPLGLRVTHNIESIIKDEMAKLGASEVFLTSLQPSEIWQSSGRWSDEVVDNWFKTNLKNGVEVGLGFTHEEMLARILSEFVSSYQDLPIAIYQIQTKFRNELRAKGGLLRGREFVMKDLYSFSKTEAELDSFYENAKEAYMNIFKRCGIGENTYITFASGGTFSKFSHEFQMICEAGEDIIYIDEESKLAINREVLSDNVLAELKLDKNKLKEAKAIEVGNIFKQGDKFSKTANLYYDDEAGEKHPVIMGAYGIGVGRLMAAIVENSHDERGIIWPIGIAPFKAHLIALEGGEGEANKLYAKLVSLGIEILYDDRPDVRAGEKFADADLIGLPLRVVVSKKSVTAGGAEIKKRNESKQFITSLTEVSSLL